MKKVLIAFLILLLLGAAAIAYFFSTTDLNQIVPVIRDQLQRTLKISIQYQQASLGWKNGLGIEIQKLSIEPQGDHPKDDVLRADEIRVHLDLFSILTGHLQIGSVDVVKPVVTIVKTRQKKILVLGLGNFSSKNTDKPASASGALPLGFLIQDLKAAEAEILYRDESASPVRVISVHGLKVKIENFSLSQPFTVEISGSLYGNAKTFDVSTRLQIPLSGEQISFTRTKAAVDFDALNFEELKIALPFLQKIPLQEIHGNLDADFEKIILGSQGIQDLSGRMNIRDGSLSLTSLQKPVRDIQVSLEISPQTLKINQADFKIATSGAGQIHGSVNNWQKDPVISLEANLDQIPLGEILEYQPSQIHLEGILSVNFRGEITPQRDPQVPLING
ncbi:MAG: AsmA family protein, partial [Candidatus Omnitrophica bacterium]|nr:AsmA family protein [Candidatus Omnitrophota bacterium]